MIAMVAEKLPMYKGLQTRAAAVTSLPANLLRLTK